MDMFRSAWLPAKLLNSVDRHCGGCSRYLSGAVRAVGFHEALGLPTCPEVPERLPRCASCGEAACSTAWLDTADEGAWFCPAVSARRKAAVHLESHVHVHGPGWVGCRESYIWLESSGPGGLAAVKVVIA